MWSSLLCELRYHNIVKYGPDEHGSRNKLTNNPTANAHHGEDTLWIISWSFGLRDIGTSITNHFPYRKKSLRLASHTTIHKTQTTSLSTKVLLALARAENNHIHIAK